MYFSKRLWFIFLAIPALIAGFGIAQVAAQNSEDDPSDDRYMFDYHAVLNDNQNMPNLMVNFIEEEDYGTVVVMLQGRDLRPGWHTLSLTSGMECDASQEFRTAGEVYNPTNEQYPYRSGDMLPLYVMRDGTVSMTYRTDQFNLMDGMELNGLALVISEGLRGITGSEPRENTEVIQPAQPDTDEMPSDMYIACGVLMEGGAPANVFVVDQTQEQNDMTTSPDQEEETDAVVFPEITPEVMVEVTLEVEAVIIEVLPEVTAEVTVEAAEVTMEANDPIEVTPTPGS